MKPKPSLGSLLAFLFAASSSALPAETLNLDLTTNNSGAISLASGDNTFSFTSFGVDYLIVAGGGGGAGSRNNNSRGGGGGGAGGLLQGTGFAISGAQTITVGGGGSGAGNNNAGGYGDNSTAFGFTAIGGGGGGNNSSAASATDGGSGGGAPSSTNLAANAGLGTAGQGNNGGPGNGSGIAGGGGGAGGAGGVGTGGIGLSSSITGSEVTYAAGGNGGNTASPDTVSVGAAAANTGNGGRGAAPFVSPANSAVTNAIKGGAGGSGIVVVSYATAPMVGQLTGGTVTTAGGKTIHSFTTTGASTLDLHSATIAGEISGTGNLNWNKTGTLTLSGTNIYTGATTVSAGTLALNATGSIANSSGVNLTASTAKFNVTTSDFTLGATQTLGGIGTVENTGRTFTANGILAPGNSPGTLTVDGGTFALGVGGDYNFQILDVTGAAGTGYDTVNLINGAALDFSSLTAASYSINLYSLLSAGPDVAGNASNFNNTQNYSWTLFSTANSLLSSFDAADFAINTGGFTNALGGGSFSVGLADGNTDLVLNFTAVPEPGVALIGSLGLLVLLRRRRHV